MRKIATNDLVAGMVTAEDIYNYSNQLVLQKGLVLNDKAISKLRFHGITTIRVEEDNLTAASFLSSLDDALTQDLLADLDSVLPAPPMAADADITYAERIRSSKEFADFSESYDSSIKLLKNQINEVILHSAAPVEVQKMLENALTLLNRDLGPYSVFDMLHVMKDNDDMTYAHSLNVGLLCHIFSGWLNMSEEDSRLALLCGLLHDVGKLKIPDAILRKKEPLSDFERKVVRSHSQQSYYLLQNMEINEHIKYAALMHHERCDGSGYPLGLSSTKIDPFAKIVAIVDAYEAMTSPRPFRLAMNPFRAIEQIEREGLQKYDPRIVMTFLRKVAEAFISSTVILSNGQEGVIVYVNQDYLTRPTVKTDSGFIDLMKEKNIEIVGIR